MRVINKENIIASLEHKDKDELISIIKKLISAYSSLYIEERREEEE